MSSGMYVVLAGVLNVTTGDGHTANYSPGEIYGVDALVFFQTHAGFLFFTMTVLVFCGRSTLQRA